MAGTQSRREFLSRTSMALGAGAALTAGAGCLPRPDGEGGGMRTDRRPNVVFLFADDLGYGDLGCYGAPDIRTPAIDKLAAEGVRLTGYYAAAPECSPTRTALMTGRYLQRAGGLECAIGVGNVGRYDDAIRLAARGDLGLPAEQSILARLLKRAGYDTAVYGKWHLGYERKFFPDRHGFDHFVGVLGGNCDYFHHCEASGLRTLYEDDRPIRRAEHMTDLIALEALRFLQRRSRGPGRPFFLYVPFTAPHSPYQGPGDRRPAPLTDDEWNKGTRAGYVELVEHMDAGVAKILAALDEAGLADNTLVFYVSDNGANRQGRNAPFSGHKSSLHEGGIRVPCIARRPGVLEAGSVWPHPSITMDLTASILAAAGTEPPADRPLDGVDVLGQIAAGTAPGKRTLFWRARRGERTWRAVRDGALKYVSRTDGRGTGEWLFDLDADPGEKTDLLAARPDDAGRLKRLLDDWQREVAPTR
jgi:arylsulfatase A-like enzyme